MPSAGQQGSITPASGRANAGGIQRCHGRGRRRGRQRFSNSGRHRSHHRLRHRLRKARHGPRRRGGTAGGPHHSERLGGMRRHRFEPDAGRGQLHVLRQAGGEVVPSDQAVAGAAAAPGERIEKGARFNTFCLAACQSSLIAASPARRVGNTMSAANAPRAVRRRATRAGVCKRKTGQGGGGRIPAE